MLAFFYYCLKVIICSGVLYGYYWMVLRNNRFHQWNRWYLLGSIVLSFGLPLLRISVPFSLQDRTVLVYGAEVLATPGVYLIKQDSSFHFSLSLMFFSAYAVIVLFMLARLVKSFRAIQKLKGIYPEENINGIHFYNTTEPGTPFSFFNNVFWNSSIDLHTVKGRQVLQHEMAHVQERHSVDALSIQLLLVFAFWNPFLYFIKRELSIVHEFIADQKASAGDDSLQYSSLLLMKALGSPYVALGHSFFHSSLKRRITMITSSINPRHNYARRVAALPVAFMLLSVFSFQCQRPAEEKQVAPKLETTAHKDTLVAAKALYIIDGRVASQQEANKLDPATIERMDVTKSDEALKQYGEPGQYGVIRITTKGTSDAANQPATFIGGTDGWKRYLEQNLQYPLEAQDVDVQGLVKVELTVKADGTVTDVKALNDPGAGLAAEAVRIIEKGPKWHPAKQNGKAVDYRFIQTITFQLGN